MRTTHGKETVETRLGGDQALAASLARALEASVRSDRYTHGFHTYPARLHPDAARDLLALFPGERVADPFCGGGTVLVEARAAGRRAWGSDLSPVAVRVARTRCATPEDAELTAFRSAARRITAAARSATTPPPGRLLRVVERWYAPGVLCELEAIRTGIEATEGRVRARLETVLSSILVKVSFRESDTSRNRVPHDRPPGTTAILFHKKARELARMQVALREAVPSDTPAAWVERGDARKVVPEEPVDLVLSSPPYPSTYDYLPIQQLRLAWLGDEAAVGSEIGSRRAWREGGRRARRRWVGDTRAWTSRWAQRLAPGGHLVVVIGDGLTPRGPVDSAAPTRDAAVEAGLEPVAAAHLGRADHARQAQRWEHVLAFRRPDRIAWDAERPAPRTGKTE